MTTIAPSAVDTAPLRGTEQSLDPADWPSMRALGHRMLDDMFTYLETIAERAVWRKPTPAAMEAYGEGMPAGATSAEQVYDEYLAHIQPHAIGNGHPRF